MFSYPQDFLDKLYSQKIRNLYVKIKLLDWQEEEIKEIQGKVIDGSINIDGSSAIRRTLSLTMILDEDRNEIDYAKKIKVSIGIANNVNHRYVEYKTDIVGELNLTRNSIVVNPLTTYNGLGVKTINANNFVQINTAIEPSVLGIENEISIIGTKIYSTTKKEIDYKNFGDIIWFPLGVYVLGDKSLTRNLENSSISINAQDKMCLLTGDIAGILSAPVRLDVDGNNNKILLYDLIYNVVTKLGGENPAKVIIKDVPLKYKQAIKYVGNENKYYDINYNELEQGNPNIAFTIKPGDYVGYKWKDLVYFDELSKSAGDTVYNILQDIVKMLGDYEFFYDVEGNFVFQQKPTFTYKTYLPLDEQTYIADFSKVPVIYNFKNKDFIISYANSLNYANIKNDFVVWGKDINDNILHYHLVIDNKPFLPLNYDKPWQQFLVEYGAGPYYDELVSKLSQIYDNTTNKWKGTFNELNYWFDMIDATSALGKFSISAIGKRTKVVVDDKINCLYPIEVPDVIYIFQDTPLEERQELQRIGQKYIVVDNLEYNYYYKEIDTGKDAFTVIRELLYYNTNYQDTINFTTIPIYHLEPNYRIEVEDLNTNISGHYIIKSISIPLNAEGLMTINAIKVYDRI